MRIAKGGIAEIYTNEELMGVRIVESGEKLVDLGEFSAFVVDMEETARSMQGLAPGVCFIRETPARMLLAAQRLLGGKRFLIRDGYRTMATQKELYRQVLEETRAAHPDWDQSQLETETDRWVANPKVVPPHTTGGALDLTIVDEAGKELDMGNPINTVGEASYMMSDAITAAARENRDLFIKVMCESGFVGNPREWWHWSYGDRRWAKTMGTAAIYGGL